MSLLRSARKLIISYAIVALVAPISVDWTVAQRSGVKGGLQQTSYESSSSQESGLNQPQSVYGGYDSQSTRFVQQSTALSAPVNNRKTSYAKQQTINTVRAPAPFITQQQSSSSYNEQISEADAEPALYGSVAGKPGVDFPGYTQVPRTSFSCDGLPYDYGMYADEETGCQAYHVCYNGRKDSFLCGVGTVFNQRILHCDYWYSVDCGKSSQYYGSNAYMGSSQPEPGPAQASGTNSYQKTEVSSTSVNRPGSVYGGYNQAPSSSSNSFSRQTIRQQQQVPLTQQQNIAYKA